MCQYSCLNSCRIKRKPVIATQSYNPVLIHKVYSQIWQEVVQLSLVNDYLVLSYHTHCPKQQPYQNLIIRLQWRIQDFPDGAVTLKGGSANLLFGHIFPENCMKTKEIGLRDTSLIPPPPPHWIRQWIGLQLMSDWDFEPNRIARNLNLESIIPYTCNFYLPKIATDWHQNPFMKFDCN